MMNVKKQVIEALKTRLVGEQRKIDSDLLRNSRSINELSNKNAVLKRERAELQKLIKSIV